jgi:hypothetical protein
MKSILGLASTFSLLPYNFHEKEKRVYFHQSFGYDHIKVSVFRNNAAGIRDFLLVGHAYY